MKIAFISDIHGNLPALKAVLRDIKKRGIEQVICTGDIVNPLKESVEVFKLLKERNIPILRGNHEDYIVDYFFGESREKWNAINFRPIKLVAEQLGKDIAYEFKNLPLGIKISGPNKKNIYACHASPSSNVKSFYDGFDKKIFGELRSVDAQAFVSGHRHVQWSKKWEDRLLVSFGSLGLPVNGNAMAEYLVMNFKDDEWTPNHISVFYDNNETLDLYKQSYFFQKGGPFAWMLYDEILMGERRIAEYFQGHHSFNIKNDEEWVGSIKKYLSQIGRWETLSNILKNCS